jgi:methanol dehydrogenase (cytochrome c) subunit 2
MKKISLPILAGAALVAAGLVGATAPTALAYDGTDCKAPGNCWEPKPGFPEKIKGTKYDPKHDAKELAKQGNSMQAAEARNKKRADNFKKTGKWVYDVSKIQSDTHSIEALGSCHADKTFFPGSLGCCICGTPFFDLAFQPGRLRSPVEHLPGNV